MEDLSDPFGDRVMKNVPPLARFPLKREELWSESGEYPTDKALPPGQKNNHLIVVIVVFEYNDTL